MSENTCTIYKYRISKCSVTNFGRTDWKTTIFVNSLGFCTFAVILYYSDSSCLVAIEMFIRFRADAVNISTLLLFLPLLLCGHLLCGSMSTSFHFLIHNFNRLVSLLLPVYSRGALTGYPEIGIRNVCIVELDRGIRLLLHILRCLIRLERGRALLVRT